MKKATLFRLMRFWPPYLGAGIRVTNVAEDLSVIEVEMRLRWTNRNYVKTHFGGSLYSMTDPFYMLILMEKLGRGYIVWDKAATIRFRRPGRATVRARFELTDERVEEIRRQADENPKVEPAFTVEIRDDDGELIAEVEKLLYVKKK